MKKFLLLAAVAVTALAANAQMNLTKAWQTTAPALANTRQGIALDGKFLINDKVQGKVFAYDENGATEMFETGATASWPAIAKDEAGNVIVRVDNSWPGSFMADTVLFKIFPAGGGDPIAVEGNIFADFAEENGRADYMGTFEGNVMEEGCLYLITNHSTGVLKVPFVEGEIDGDHIALIPVNGASGFANTGAVVEPWTAADGTKHYMLYWRGINPYDMVLNEDGDEFTATAFTLPGRSNLTGIRPFSRDGKNLVAYSLKPADRNYGDGWAIAEMNAEEPLFSVEDTGLDLNNGGVCVQWLDIDGDKLFQYAGANYIACYEFEGGAEEPTYAVCGAPAALFGMENDWDPIAAPEMTLNEETGLYEWTSAETELAAGNVEFKVVQNHAWDVCFPENNYVIPVEAAGNYTLAVTYNPETNEVNATLTGTPLPEPRKVYIIGEVNGNSWATNVGVEMETTDDKVYTADVVLVRPENRDEEPAAQYCYFSFATKLMEAADDWAGLAPYRFGAVSESTEDNPNGDFHFYHWMMGQPLQLTYNGDPRAFMVPEGTYTFTVDMEALTLTIVGEFTGIETINLNNAVQSGRYNLLGQPVNENYKGIVIENGVKKIQK
ncbi:MAG: hypothetical protein IKX31_01685 [Muribaculaceae bacterium]|nr:hypothetical protein [Muribaculaceae bacterium]